MRSDNPTPSKGGTLLPACRLYRKTSGTTGAPYLMGCLGGLRVLILPKRDGEEGEHSHNLLLSEAAQRDGWETGL